MIAVMFRGPTRILISGVLLGATLAASVDVFAQNNGLGGASSTTSGKDSVGLSTVKENCDPKAKQRAGKRDNEGEDCIDPGSGDASGLRPEASGMSPPSREPRRPADRRSSSGRTTKLAAGSELRA